MKFKVQLSKLRHKCILSVWKLSVLLLTALRKIKTSKFTITLGVFSQSVCEHKCGASNVPCTKRNGA